MSGRLSGLLSLDRWRPTSSKFSGASQASNARARAGQSESITAYHAVSRLSLEERWPPEDALEGEAQPRGGCPRRGVERVALPLVAAVSERERPPHHQYMASVAPRSRCISGEKCTWPTSTAPDAARCACRRPGQSHGRSFDRETRGTSGPRRSSRRHRRGHPLRARTGRMADTSSCAHRRQSGSRREGRLRSVRQSARRERSGHGIGSRGGSGGGVQPGRAAPIGCPSGLTGGVTASSAGFADASSSRDRSRRGSCSTSSSVVAQEETLIRMAGTPVPFGAAAPASAVRLHLRDHGAGHSRLDRTIPAPG